ncbi:MAG: hypothetical protein Q9178_000772 [Gyalolechia marmorata]
MAGTQDIITQPAASLLTMATEIHNEVFRYLHKEDLKILRCVCHRLDQTTSPFLFDKVIITSIINNVGLFECVVNNPNLAQHVKTLVFDIPQFRDVNAAYYFQYLMQQVQNDVDKHLPGMVLAEPKEDIMKRVQDMKECVDPGQQGFPLMHAPEVLLKDLEKAHFFRDPGRTRDRVAVLATFNQDLASCYDIYVNMRTKQQENIDTSLPRCVTDAFMKCVNVQQVEVQTEWQAYEQPIDDRLESLLPIFPSSGAVARHYRPLLLRPIRPVHGDPSHKQFLLRLFDKIGCAQNQIVRIKLGKGFIIPMDGLDTVDTLPRNVANSFQHLASLTLWMSTYHFKTARYLVDWLGPALKNVPKLKHLEIGACNSTKYKSIDLYRLRLIPLLQGCVWPELRTLALTGMVGSVKEFLALFKSHKGLRSLCLSSITIRVDSHSPCTSKDGTASISKDLMHLFRNMGRLMNNLCELSIEFPFKTESDMKEEWGPPAKDFLGFKSMWEYFILHPDLMDLEDPKPGMYDFKNES